MKHTIKSVRILAATFITFGTLAGGAKAALIITFSDAGSGQTRIQLSGSTQVISGTNDTNGYWFDPSNLGGFTVSGTSTAVSATGSFSATTPTQPTINLQDVFLRGTTGGGSGGFGIRMSPAPVFGTGDAISWSGDILITRDFSNFPVGNYIGTTTMGTDGNFVTVSESIQVNVIPEPTSALLLGLSTFGLAFHRRRKTR